MVAQDSADGATGLVARNSAMAVFPTTMLVRGERKTASSASVAVSAVATPLFAIAPDRASAADARAARSTRRSMCARRLASEESVGETVGSVGLSQADRIVTTAQSTKGTRMTSVSGEGLGGPALRRRWPRVERC